MIVNKVRAYVLSGAMLLGANACHNTPKNEKLLQKAATEVCHNVESSLFVKRFKSAKDSVSFLKDSTEASIHMDKVDSMQDVIKNKALFLADKKRKLVYRLADAERTRALNLIKPNEAKVGEKAKNVSALALHNNTYVAGNGKTYDVSVKECAQALDKYDKRVYNADLTWDAETEKAYDLHLKKGGEAYDTWLDKIKKSEKDHCTPEYLKKTQSP